MRNQTKVAIIILNWNGWQDTIECLESLQRISYPNYRIIVVDNGSTNGSVEKIKAWAHGEIPVRSKFLQYDLSTKPIRYVQYDRAIAEAGGKPELEAYLGGVPSHRQLALIQIDKNLGFAAGNNVGIRYALKLMDTHYIAVLNNDTVVHPDWLTYSIKTLSSAKIYYAVAPKILLYSSPSRIQYAGAKLTIWRGGAYHIGAGRLDGSPFCGIRKTEHVTGCAFVARSQLFQELGLLDEDFFFGHEDVEMSCRAKKEGIFFAVSLDATVWHKVGSTSRHAQLGSCYSLNKYRFLVVRKHGRSWKKMLFALFYVATRIPKFLLLIIKGQRGLVISEVKG